MLAQVRTADDARKIMDVASAAEHYAKKAQLGQDAIDHAHAIKIDAQRMLGEFLSKTPKAKGCEHGGRRKIDGPRREPSNPTPTLAAIGLSKKLSADSQKLATVAATKPAVYEQVRAGKLSVQQAARTVINERKKKELAAKAAAAQAPADDTWRIVEGDCVAQLKTLASGSARRQRLGRQEAAALLAQVRTADDARKIMDVASAAEHYAKKAQLGQDAIEHAHAIKIDAQRMLGEFLSRTPKNSGAKGVGPIAVPKKNRNDAPTLSAIGLSKKLSADSQKLATVAATKPAVYEQVRAGKLSVQQAARSVINERKKKELAAKAAAAPALADDTWRIVEGDCVAQLKTLASGSARRQRLGRQEADELGPAGQRSWVLPGRGPGEAGH